MRHATIAPLPLSGGAPVPGPARVVEANAPAPRVRPRLPRPLAAYAAVTLRLARATDAALLARFYADLHPQSRRERFHGAVNNLPAALIEHFARHNDKGEASLLAVAIDGAGVETLLGEARYAIEAGGRTEFALAVADGAQRRGIGRRLLEAVIARAAAYGACTVHGDVLPDNLAMLTLAQSLGFAERRSRSDPRLRTVERRVGACAEVVGA